MTGKLLNGLCHGSIGRGSQTVSDKTQASFICWIPLCEQLDETADVF